MGNMKVHHHQFARGCLWEQQEPSLTLGCKSLRPLAPNTTHFDLKSFIKSPQSGPQNLSSSDSDSLSVSDDNKKYLPTSPQGQAESTTHPCGTRWNPTQEQIGILEMLYRGGMRTPNAQQIEEITVQLGNYGKIEGKNVFYWFQNHKARERQKQKKRNNTLSLISHTPHPTPTTTIHTITTSTNFDAATAKVGGVVERYEEDNPYKKCRTLVFECLEEQKTKGSIGSKEEKEEEHRTLELFPLHPESR